ncbi:MAG: DPP IV N-terminal domain-containing protein [Bacteroidaceae bacterium]|nr:DPP IV N-terminal domain-containing protein [Bacteroidaceae bacterium]
MNTFIKSLVIAMAVSTNVMAQDRQLFTIDDLIPGGKTYYSLVPENAYYTWWGNQLLKQEVERVMKVDADGKMNVLFSLADINRWLRLAGKRELRHLLYTKFVFADKTEVLFDLNDEHVAVDWTSGEVKSYGAIKDGSENADFCAANGMTAFTVAHNLYLAHPDGKVSSLSLDGSLDLVYGESVHRNEFGIEKGTFWSPKGRRLAFYRMDQSMVTTYPQVDVSARVAELVPDKYPMAGMTSHKVTVGVYDTQTLRTIYLDAGDPTDRYFTNIAWSPDEESIYMIELNRDQNHAQLVQYDATTGKKVAVLFDERNSKYVEPMHPIQFLPWDDTKFIYQSRKDGYLHIYLYNTKGEQLAQLTKGEWEVMSVAGFNTKTKSIVYTSNAIHPLQQNIFSVDMRGRITRLDNGEGWHTVQLSQSGSMMVDTYSSPTVARNIDLTPTQGKGKPVRLLTAAEPWDRFRVPEMKVGSLKAADGVTDVYYRLILPTDFDPTKRYPAVIYVYGGPHAHNIDASRHWGVRGWDIWMAQQGYVMFCLDNRGSEHRGLAFEQATFRQLGVEEMKDQIKGVEYLKSLPYVDADRIGVHGWSFGGFMTTSLMTTYPETFKVGVAGGPVIDWKYYEVMYGERYMDTPQSNPEGYAKTSLLGKAGNLKGRLLVIYGGNDNTCVPQHTLSFIRACIDADTYPDLFTYPGDEHNMMGTDRIHLHNKITQYFNDYLK